MGRYKIPTLPIMGMEYRDISVDYLGEFDGYAICDFHVKDQNSVAIYHKDGKHLGYLEKGNIDIHKRIIKNYNGKLFVWGEIKSNDNAFSGIVHVPINASTEELKDLNHPFVSSKLKLEKREMDIISRRKQLSFKNWIILLFLNILVFGSMIFIVNKCEL